MKADRFRLFRRRKVFYAQDSITGKQESLRTKDRKTVERWLLAKNEAHAHPVINLGVARAHLLAHDPRMNSARGRRELAMVSTAWKRSSIRWTRSSKSSALGATRSCPAKRPRLTASA
jgi:hypothetical protein